ANISRGSNGLISAHQSKNNTRGTPQHARRSKGCSVVDGEMEAETRLTMVVGDGRIGRDVRIAGTGVVPSGKLNIDLVRSIDANSICRSIWKEAEHGDWIHVPHIALHHPLVGSEPQIIRGE